MRWQHPDGRIIETYLNRDGVWTAGWRADGKWRRFTTPWLRHYWTEIAAEAELAYYAEAKKWRRNGEG